MPGRHATGVYFRVRLRAALMPRRRSHERRREPPCRCRCFDYARQAYAMPTLRQRCHAACLRADTMLAYVCRHIAAYLIIIRCFRFDDAAAEPLFTPPDVCQAYRGAIRHYERR